SITSISIRSGTGMLPARPSGPGRRSIATSRRAGWRPIGVLPLLLACGPGNEGDGYRCAQPILPTDWGCDRVVQARLDSGLTPRVGMLCGAIDIPGGPMKIQAAVTREQGAEFSIEEVRL